MKTSKFRFVSSMIVLATPFLWSNASMAQTAVKRPVIIDTAAAYSATSVATFNSEVVEDGDHKFVVLINNPKEEKVDIILRTPAGERHFDHTEKVAFSKRFDLTDAPTGVYTVIIRRGKTAIVKEINFNTTTEAKNTLEIK